MKKIIGVLRPFDLVQKFYVYENGNKIDAVGAKLDEIPTTVLGLSQQYDVHQLDLTGPKQFSKGISSKIKEEDIDKSVVRILRIKEKYNISDKKKINSCNIEELNKQIEELNSILN